MRSAIIELNRESSRSASRTGRRTDGKQGAVPSGNRRHAEKIHVCATRQTLLCGFPDVLGQAIQNKLENGQRRRSSFFGNLLARPEGIVISQGLS